MCRDEYSEGRSSALDTSWVLSWEMMGERPAEIFLIWHSNWNLTRGRLRMTVD